MLYLTTTQVYTLINYTAFIESLAVAASVGALLWLRWKRPEMERPIKVNILLPILFFITCIFLVVLPFYVSPYETGIGALITLSGIPIYLVTVAWKRKPRTYQRLIGKFNIFPKENFLKYKFFEQNHSQCLFKNCSIVLKKTKYFEFEWIFFVFVATISTNEAFYIFEYLSIL